MTQAGEIAGGMMEKLGRDFAAIRAQQAEIVVRCPEHGEFTRQDMIQARVEMWDIPHGQCPECFRATVASRQRERRIKNAVDFFISGSGVPLRFHAASFEAYKPENAKAQKILAHMREYAENFEQHSSLGRSLILCGGPGTGKTHLACAVLFALAREQAITGIYTTAYRAVQDVRDSYRSREISERQAMDAFIKPGLLVLDEVGVQYGTDSEHLILFSILNGRYEAMKPTIVVSNLNVDGVIKYLDERVYDRLRENGGGVLAFDWGSWRQKGKK